MFEWFRKRKITKLADATKAYVDTNYAEPPKPSAAASSGIGFSMECPGDTNIRYSRRAKLPEDKKGNTAFSLEGVDDESTEPRVLYSSRRRDAYSSHSIDNAVRSLSSGNSASGILKDLENHTDMSFVDKMLEYINIKQMRDSDVYKAAQVDRRLFSKIISDRTYKPAKDTCIALSFALKLSLTEANDFLSRAGYVLSHSSKRDVVIEYFFREQIYDLKDVNEVLFRLNQKTIGR
jgi:hypothetical protein